MVESVGLTKPCLCINRAYCSPRLQNPDGYYCRFEGGPVPAASSACPMCGGTLPHTHTSEQFAEFRVKQTKESKS